MEKHIETVFLTLRDKWDDSSHLEILINAFVKRSPARLDALAETWTTVSSAYI